MANAKIVLLVHGAWANASCWSKVIPLLEEAEFNVTAIPLALTAFEDDVAAVSRAIASESGPVLLVGHSYGGVVITEAGTDSKVAGLVYVAAFAPDNGESAASLGASAEPAPMNAEIRTDQQGFLKLTRAGVSEGFAQDLPEIEKGVLFATQSPTAATILGSPVSTPAWRTRPSWYLVSAEDRAIQPALQRTMAKRIGAQTSSILASHLVMLSRPETVRETDHGGCNVTLKICLVAFSCPAYRTP